MARSSGRRDGTGQSAARRSELQAELVERIWQVVALIPRGRVATYGQVAALAGMPRHARLVGRTLRDLPDGTRLPWHRVVNATLRISQRRGSDGHTEQRRRLEAEGISFVGERIPRQFRWEATAP